MPRVTSEAYDHELSRHVYYDPLIRRSIERNNPESSTPLTDFENSVSDHNYDQSETVIVASIATFYSLLGLGTLWMMEGPHPENVTFSTDSKALIAGFIAAASTVVMSNADRLMNRISLDQYTSAD